MNNFLHQTAIIDKKSSIGNNNKFWHWTHISENVQIGNNCVFGQNVYVSKNVEIGNNVKIQNNVSVYEGVIIKDNVFCGPSVVFTNVINPRSFVNRKSEFKKTIINYGSTLGANCTIICGITIGEFSFIGAGSVVTKDVKNFSLNFGNPSSQRGWVTKEGNKLSLPLTGRAEEVCKLTGDKYILKDDICNYVANI